MYACLNGDFVRRVPKMLRMSCSLMPNNDTMRLGMHRQPKHGLRHTRDSTLVQRLAAAATDRPRVDRLCSQAIGSAEWTAIDSRVACARLQVAKVVQLIHPREPCIFIAVRGPTHRLGKPTTRSPRHPIAVRTGGTDRHASGGAQETACGGGERR